MAQAALSAQAGGAVIVEGGTAGAFAAQEVEERYSVLIKCRGVILRLEGIADGQPASHIDQLLPWGYPPIAS